MDTGEYPGFITEWIEEVKKQPPDESGASGRLARVSGFLEEPVTQSDRVLVRVRPDLVITCAMANESYTSQLMQLETGADVTLIGRYYEKQKEMLDCIVPKEVLEVKEEQDEKSRD